MGHELLNDIQVVQFGLEFMQKISIEFPTVKYNIEKCKNRQTAKVLNPFAAGPIQGV